MPNTAPEKFSSQAAPEVLTERKEKGQPRRQAMDAFEQSLSEFDQLYRELAK
jgi:hypothetical protein